MTDIVLNGVSIAVLRQQKAAIQKDASAFIAQGLKDAKTLLATIVEASEGDEDDERDNEGIDAAAAQAMEILENVRIVSGVSGVEFYLPFSHEGYYDETPYSFQLEEAGLPVYDEGKIGELFDVLGNMEYDSRNWHSSRC